MKYMYFNKITNKTPILVKFLEGLFKEKEKCDIEKKWMEDAGLYDTIEYINIICRRTALKLILNKTYGICADKSNPLYLLPFAVATTSQARACFNIIFDTVTGEMKSIIVFGDTDSIMFEYNKTTIPG